MSKLKLLSIAVVGLLIINLCIVGFLLFRKPPHPREGAMGPKTRIIEMLHFDNEQIIKYENLIDRHQEKIKQLRNDMRDVKSRLYQTLNEEGADSRDSLINQLGILQKEIETVHYDHFVEIKKLCRPDQSEYFNTLSTNLADFFDPEKGGARSPKK